MFILQISIIIVIPRMRQNECVIKRDCSSLISVVCTQPIRAKPKGHLESENIHNELNVQYVTIFLKRLSKLFSCGKITTAFLK